MLDLYPSVEEAISQATGKPFDILRDTPLAGGCIHDSSRIDGKDGRVFFLKVNGIDATEVLTTEADALTHIHQTRSLRVPQPVTTGSSDSKAFLVLEFLNFGKSSPAAYRLMGEQLASLHRHSARKFGWEGNNFIGLSPQHNTWSEDWITFYRDYRLKPQVEWARQNGWQDPHIDGLMDGIDHLFKDYQPVPSLLHGDLWGGNAAILDDGTPVVYDPASYYGDRETDIAFSTFFGGFSSVFYEAYNAAWPLATGHQKRRALYNLYHALNHFNLFGGHYGQQASQLTRQALP